MLHTHRPDELPIVLVEVVERSGVENAARCGHAGGQVVGLDDRVVSRVELELDHVAHVRGDAMRRVLMRVLLGSYLDGVRGDRC